MANCFSPFFSLLFYFAEISIFNSEYIAFYGLGILGFIVSVLGRRLPISKEDLVTRFIDNLGFFGTLAIVILFFPPIYVIWGTLIFGP